MTKWVSNIYSVELKTCIEDTGIKAERSVKSPQKYQNYNESYIYNNFLYVEKIIPHKARISLCDILHPWNHILCALKVQTIRMAPYYLWTSVLEKLRTI